MPAAIAALALTSCQTIQPYVPPTGGNTAKLLIRPSISSGMSYGIYTYADPHACRNSQRIVAGNAATGNPSSTLRAGPLATLLYAGIDRNRMCQIAFSFYPKARHIYLLATSQDGEGCGLRLLDATNGDEPKMEKSFVRRAISGTGCDPLNKNVRSGDAINQSYHGSDNGAPLPSRSLDDFKDLLPK
jgi:hypothetical protein